MRCDAEALAILASQAGAKLVPATEQDWYEEYLAPVISVKVVDGIDAAIAQHHILQRRQPLNAHRATRMKLVGRDADFSAQAELETVGEAGACIDHHAG